MNKPNNVIDLSKRLKSKTRERVKPVNMKKALKKQRSESAPVVDMTRRRQAILQQERRTVKRTILSEFVGAFIVVPHRGLCKVALYDISERGLAFDLETELGQLRNGEEIAMRVYMNQHTYFPFVVTITNVRTIIDEGLNRHGAEFVKGTINDKALHHFVKFIENVSASLKTDHGDVMVSNLRGK